MVIYIIVKHREYLGDASYLGDDVLVAVGALVALDGVVTERQVAEGEQEGEDRHLPLPRDRQEDIDD